MAGDVIKVVVDAFLAQVKENLLSRCGVQPGERLLVAVSGGVDSVVLLDVLEKLSRDVGLRLVVAHFNHGLRGRAADLDEEFVRRLALSYGLPYCVGRGDVRQHARSSGISIEMAARELRHRFLHGAAMLYGAGKIALGHQLDDQVELFFLRVLRGSGGEGLGGMEWVSPSPVSSGIESVEEKLKVYLVRPLLSFRRRDLERYARRARLKYRLDVTNLGLDYERNRIRHELLPKMVQLFGEKVYVTVPRVMDVVGAEAQFVREYASKMLDGVDAVQFDTLPVAVQRQFVVLQLLRAGLEYDFEKVERLRLAEGKWVTFPGGVRVRRDSAGRLEIGTGTSSEGWSEDVQLRVELDGKGGTIRFGSVGVKWSILAREGTPLEFRPGRCEYFDADSVGRRVVLRHWRAGDRFRPIGYEVPVKLQDLFVNSKIPREARHRLVIAESEGGEIFWVQGLRIGDSFKITPKTRRVLKWEILEG